VFCLIVPWRPIALVLVPGERIELPTNGLQNRTARLILQQNSNACRILVALTIQSAIEKVGASGEADRRI
jgi:hypothetical protein